MTTADFISFKDHVLSNNPYFNEGYAMSFKDDETKEIFAQDGTGFRHVFPLDTKGNYFYLRVDSGMRLSPNIATRVADCGAGRLGFDDQMDIQLVAIVTGADEWTLLNNLRNTAMMYSSMDMIPTSALTIREQVVEAELSGHPDILTALKNLKNETIVRLTLSTVSRYVASECIVDPCKTC